MGAHSISFGSVLSEVAIAIGEDAALALARNLGGQRLYVPRNFAPTHGVVAAIGVEHAQRLSDHFHGTVIAIPVKQRRRWLVRTMDARRPRPSTAEIAKAAGVTERTVYSILSEPDDTPTKRRVDDRQADLFTRGRG